MSNEKKENQMGVVLLVCLAGWCFCAFILGYEQGKETNETCSADTKVAQ